MKKILIVGAGSAMAKACARLWAAQGAHLAVCVRDPEVLALLADDLKARGASAVVGLPWEALDAAAHDAVVDKAWASMGGVDVALVAHGSLPDQSACEASAALTVQAWLVNGASAAGVTAAIVHRMRAQGHGAVGVITSVAGDRGRPSNFVYGSAKAGLQAFCEGLQAGAWRDGVSVTDLRPGFVATPMTQGLALPQALVVRPEAIAPRMVAAIERGQAVAYVPGFWRAIMAVIRAIPGPVFRRLKL